jgi:hypothetical protein
MTDEESISVLTEDLDKEVLEKMPLWFRRLREAHTGRLG